MSHTPTSQEMMLAFLKEGLKQLTAYVEAFEIREQKLNVPQSNNPGLNASWTPNGKIKDGLSSKAQRIYHYLTTLDYTAGYLTITNAELARVFRCTSGTISLRIRELELRGFLSKQYTKNWGGVQRRIILLEQPEIF